MEYVYSLNSDYADDYLNEISDEDKQELEALIIAWFENKAEKPRFWLVKNTMKETVTSEEI